MYPGVVRRQDGSVCLAQAIMYVPGKTRARVRLANGGTVWAVPSDAGRVWIEVS